MKTDKAVLLLQRTVRLLLVGQRGLEERETHRSVVFWIMRAWDAPPLLLRDVRLNAVLAVTPGAWIVAAAVREAAGTVAVAGAGIWVKKLPVASGHESIGPKVGRDGHEELGRRAVRPLAPAPAPLASADVCCVRPPASEHRAARGSAHRDLHVGVLHRGAAAIEEEFVDVRGQHFGRLKGAAELSP